MSLLGNMLRDLGPKVERLEDLKIARVAGLELFVAGLWIGQAFRFPCTIDDLAVRVDADNARKAEGRACHIHS